MQQPNSLFFQQPNMYVGIQQYNFPAQPIMIQPQQQNIRLPPLQAISEQGILSDILILEKILSTRTLLKNQFHVRGKIKAVEKLKQPKESLKMKPLCLRLPQRCFCNMTTFGVTRPPPKKLRQQQNKLRQRPRETKRVQTQRVQSLLHSPQRARSCRPALRPARAVAAPLNALRAVAAPLLAPRAQSPPNSSPRAQSPHRPLHASPASPSTPLNSKAEG